MNKTLRQVIKLRANYLCEYCLCSEYFSPDPFECDHIIPVAKEGSDDLDNFASFYSGCNGYKGDATETIDHASGRMVSIYNPRNHIWKEHFCWNETYTLIIGISSIRRATVTKLKLNREGVVNLRKVLRQVGEFPNIEGLK
jgi:hypothetical protein